MTETATVISTDTGVESMTENRLYIATQDPRGSGGVATMAKFVYECAEGVGLDPCLVFNMLDKEKQIRLSSPWELLTTKKRNRIQQMTARGMEAKGIPLVFPEIEPLQYVLNLRAWRHAVADGDSFFAVGGTNHVGLPFTFDGRQFASWTATPLWEDRRDRLRYAPTIERIRDVVSKPVLLALERFAFERADTRLLLSEYTRSVVCETHGFSPDEFEIFPFPIDTKQFSPDGPIWEGSNSDGPTVIFVGRINDPRKNVDDLIEAFLWVKREIPAAQLRLIGATPNTRLKNKVKHHRLGDVIEFPGRIPNDELAQHYRQADLFAMASAQEGLAIVGLEAMACGLPVISTKCGGPEQYVIDDKTGYLVEVGDSEALGRQIVSVLTEDGATKRLGTNARKLIESEYSAYNLRKQFKRVIDSL